MVIPYHIDSLRFTYGDYQPTPAWTNENLAKVLDRCARILIPPPHLGGQITTSVLEGFKDYFKRFEGAISILLRF